MIYRPNTLLQIIMDNSLIMIGCIIITAYVYAAYYKYVKIHRNTINGDELMKRYLLLETMKNNRK